PESYDGFRRQVSSTDRPMEHVPPEEIGNAMVALCRAGAGMRRDELLTQTATVFGYKRRAAAATPALEAALAEADRVPTLIFDEVDAGIGGVVAHHVARQLRAVAEHHQVIVVTHLAQIAAAADRHLVVEKSPRGGRTVTSVREVSGDERVREVSRLLGGDPERDVSRHHAEELLAGRP
ncbi:MAG: hypothetical protein KY397_03875, partial [Gemmatimonadetes bacterium]|nr:hypothetical protein [Gemmatimonadota bacterium]